jgi:hypothetical protein
MDLKFKDYAANDEIVERLRVENLEALIIETPKPRGEPSSSQLYETAIWIGRFVEAVNNRCPWGFIFHQQTCMAVCRSSHAKEPQIRQGLIELFGGKTIARGGKRCEICKGARTVPGGRLECDNCDGTGRSAGKREGSTKTCPKCHGKGDVPEGRVQCVDCGGTGFGSAPGPLKDMRDHLWSALAVAVTWLEDENLVHNITPVKQS